MFYPTHSTAAPFVRKLSYGLFVLTILLLSSCATQEPTAPVEVTVIKEMEVEVTREVTVEVEREVTREVEVIVKEEVTVEVMVEPEMLAAGMSKQPVYPIEDEFGEPIEGAEAILMRDEDGISVEFATVDLPVNHVVTLWAYTFNNPSACDAPCNQDDVFINGATPPLFSNADGTMGREGIDFTLLGMGGQIVDESGTATFTGQIAKNTAPQVVFGNGLHNPLGAEIHFALRDHGPASDDAEMLESQLNVGNGGCANFAGNGDYMCVDFQIAIFGQ